MLAKACVLLSIMLVSMTWAGTATVKPSPAAPAADGSGLVVTRSAVATDLEENEPVHAAETFPADVKRLYCFSQVKGAKDSAEIEHRWYWNDRLISSIPLKIRSGNWRTYSIKTIAPGMTGEWMVSIVNTEKEAVLKTLKFTVQ
jgi:hypothetical protein